MRIQKHVDWYKARRRLLLLRARRALMEIVKLEDKIARMERDARK